MSKSFASCASIPTPPHLGRLSDLQAAQLWLHDIGGELFYTSNTDAKHGAFFVYESVPELNGRKRCTVKYLSEPQIESRILTFLVSLCEQGASCKITPGKLRSVKVLAGLLLLQQEGRK